VEGPPRMTKTWVVGTISSEHTGKKNGDIKKGKEKWATTRPPRSLAKRFLKISGAKKGEGTYKSRRGST